MWRQPHWISDPQKKENFVREYSMIFVYNLGSIKFHFTKFIFWCGPKILYFRGKKKKILTYVSNRVLFFLKHWLVVTAILNFRSTTKNQHELFKRSYKTHMWFLRRFFFNSSQSETIIGLKHWGPFRTFMFHWFLRKRSKCENLTNDDNEYKVITIHLKDLWSRWAKKRSRKYFFSLKTFLDQVSVKNKKKIVVTLNIFSLNKKKDKFENVIWSNLLSGTKVS